MAYMGKEANKPRLNASEKTKSERQQLVDKIIEKMEEGKLYWLSGWNTKALSPYNPISDISYQGGNRFKLYCEAVERQFEDPRWCTYLQAKSKGWKVKKGESGTLLEKWVFNKEVVRKDESGKVIYDKAGNKIYDTIELSQPIVNYFYVFNAAQLTGVPETEKKEIISEDKEEVKNDLIKSSECPINMKVQDKACYNYEKDIILMPPESYFYDIDNLISTLIHEMAHSTGHESRLNREIKNEFGSEKYAMEELRAELSSAFLKADLGMEIKEEEIENHSAYLQSWIKVLKNNPDELYKAARDAQIINDRLLNNYEKVKEKDCLKDKDLSSLCKEDKSAGKRKLDRNKKQIVR